MEYMDNAKEVIDNASRLTDSVCIIKKDGTKEQYNVQKVIEAVKKSATRMISLSFFSYLILCLILILCRNAFPAIYNTDQKIKELASIFIFQTAIFNFYIVKIA